MIASHLNNLLHVSFLSSKHGIILKKIPKPGNGLLHIKFCFSHMNSRTSGEKISEMRQVLQKWLWKTFKKMWVTWAARFLTILPPSSPLFANFLDNFQYHPIKYEGQEYFHRSNHNTEQDEHMWCNRNYYHNDSRLQNRCHVTETASTHTCHIIIKQEDKTRTQTLIASKNLSFNEKSMYLQ